MWFVRETEGIDSPQIINDSKTPSGQIHVGSLRGVVLHDVIGRTFRQNGVSSTFIYGLDDMDPLDGLPTTASEQLQASLGKPLYTIAAPAGSQYRNLAEHYAADFLATFDQLGVAAQIYRMSEEYASGRFNQAIETILNNALTVREIYHRVSKSQRPDDWYPYQVVCEQCGTIGSTRAYNFDGKEVQYQCVPNYTSWANGCGYKGSISPFNGNGKLVWKLEWVAKWHTFGVTFEGAGKDHCTRGGSRDVANSCYRQIFGKAPPRNMPYEFFLVSGSKMSSSKGIGASAASIHNLLPPTVLRFLMIHTPPKRTVNFATDQQFFVKLFNEYNTVCRSDDPASRQLARMIGITAPPTFQPVGLQLLIALLQLPHIDLREAIRQRYQLDQAQWQELESHIATVTTWLAQFASTADRITICQQRPDSLNQLPAQQCELLRLVADAIDNAAVLDDEQMQQLLFDCARLVPCPPREAFIAVYRAFLDSDNGPKAGSLLAYLDRDMVQTRLRSCPVDPLALAQAVGMQGAALVEDITRQEAQSITLKLVEVSAQSVSLLAILQLHNGKVIARRSLPVLSAEGTALIQTISRSNTIAAG